MCGLPKLLAEFHRAYSGPFGGGSIDNSDLRIALHREETRELIEALQERDLPGAAKELADVVYVAYGTAHSLGIPLDAVLAEVHRSNMSKLDKDGMPLLRKDGKVLKGPHYRPPNVAAVLANRCPRCDAPDPKLPPAVQYAGEVQVCPHEYHALGGTA